MTTDTRLAALLADHRASVGEYAARAGAVDVERWLVPRAEGKWTPAQETRHLILAYDAFLRDVKGIAVMRLKGSWLRRRLWRLIGLRSILWRKRIPVAVRAPRESRPDWEPAPPAELLPLFRERAAEFEAIISTLWHSEPQRTVTHPFFGNLTLDQALQLVAVHNRHHAAFLPERAARTG